ncbi:MAG: protein kinase, partial [Myxococcota bacterium]|nr:protein kinase [Myxococcota bacterium]
MTLRSGTVLGGRYRVLSMIARGGMGAVYEAHDARLERTVALKVLLPQLADDRESLGRFEREALAAARLTHPGVVAIHDVGTEPDDTRYLVMERVVGRTISQVLSEGGRLAPERAADITAQALAALSHAHSQGVVHRDLKPGNLMVVPIDGGGEHVKVLDFGIAQLKTGAAYARLTQTGAIIGTPMFMAPEQAQGSVADERTDVYAMGVLLWCMLTGRRPFGGDAGELIVHVLRTTPARADEVAPDVPPALADVAATAMEKVPARRFQSAAAFAGAIRAAMEHGTRTVITPARPPSEHDPATSERPPPSPRIAPPYA